MKEGVPVSDPAAKEPAPERCGDCGHRPHTGATCRQKVKRGGFDHARCGCGGPHWPRPEGPSEEALERLARRILDGPLNEPRIADILGNAFAILRAKLAEAERAAVEGQEAFDEQNQRLSDCIERLAEAERREEGFRKAMQVYASDSDKFEAALREEREKWGRLVEAADWVEHLICGVGKAGDPPTPDEWEEAHEALRAALAPFQPTEEKQEPHP